MTLKSRVLLRIKLRGMEPEVTLKCNWNDPRSYSGHAPRVYEKFIMIGQYVCENVWGCYMIATHLKVREGSRSEPGLEELQAESGLVCIGRPFDSNANFYTAVLECKIPKNVLLTEIGRNVLLKMLERNYCNSSIFVG